MRVMLMCPHEFDVALCDVTVKNEALSFSWIGNPCTRGTKVLQHPNHNGVQIFRCFTILTILTT